MKIINCVAVIYVICVFNMKCSANICGKQNFDTDPDQPLILTSLINQGRIKEAQEAAKVDSHLFAGVESYSGYFTVDELYYSNSFFWFFPSEANYANAPVVLWLQGGPGSSSLYGLFYENGPFYFNNILLLLSDSSWTRNHSVLYIDNPVGTGFSFTDDGGYTRDEVTIGNHLYTALLQFFQLFPDLQKNDFFVTGESYAGKYVPAVSYTIHKNNPTAKLKINLKGLAMGNGLSDPEHQLDYADYLYQLGLVDGNGKHEFKEKQHLTIAYIKNKQWRLAFDTFDSILNGDLSETTLFKNLTGLNNYYNYLNTSSADDLDSLMPIIREAIHVGAIPYSDGNIVVEKNLREDMPKSVAPWISELLSHYRVLIYNGQLDIIVAYPLTVNYLRHLKFSGAHEYKTAKRHQWYVGKDLAGYVKQAGNLTEVLVRNAGHMVPADQPLWAMDMLTRFTYNIPYY